MKKYKVFKEVVHTFVAEVEAESEEEANRIAERECDLSVKIDIGKKMDILRNVIESFEKAAMFSVQEFLRGDGLSDEEINMFYDNNLINIPLALRIIEEFSFNSDQDPREYLQGADYSSKYIDYLLSESEEVSEKCLPSEDWDLVGMDPVRTEHKSDMTMQVDED